MPATADATRLALRCKLARSCLLQDRRLGRATEPDCGALVRFEVGASTEQRGFEGVRALPGGFAGTRAIACPTRAYSRSVARAPLRSGFTAWISLRALLSSLRADSAPKSSGTGAQVVGTSVQVERNTQLARSCSSNLVFGQWDRIFKNPMTTAAAIDRLVHHSAILEFVVPSFRTETAKGRLPAKNAKPRAADEAS